MDVEFIGNNRRREAAQACEDCSIPAVMVASLTATTSFHRHLIICPPLWRRKPLQYISHVHADIGGGVKTRTKTLSFFHKLLIFQTSSSVYLYVSVLGLELHWNIIKMVKTNTIRHLCLQPSCGAAAQSLQKSRGAWPADTAQDVMWKTSRDTATARNDSCSIQSGTDAVFGWFFQASFPVIYKTHIVCFSIRLRQKFKENMQLNMSLLWLGRGLVKC